MTPRPPDPVEKDDEGRPYPCGAFVSDDGRWFCRLESDHAGQHEWVLRTRRPDRRSCWRPIDTAPKDGRMLLGLFGPDWIEGFYSMPDGSWHWHDGDSRDDPPTHWMPLPEPPQ